MTRALLETRGLCKSFGALEVAREIDFRLERGARHALIGPNGAGKTTFVNLLSGLLRPSRGRVLLDGEDLTGLRAGEAREARDRAHLPDQPAVPRPDGAGERLHRGGRAPGRGSAR